MSKIYILTIENLNFNEKPQESLSKCGDFGIIINYNKKWDVDSPKETIYSFYKHGLLIINWNNTGDVEIIIEDIKRIIGEKIKLEQNECSAEEKIRLSSVFIDEGLKIQKNNIQSITVLYDQSEINKIGGNMSSFNQQVADRIEECSLQDDAQYLQISDENFKTTLNTLEIDYLKRAENPTLSTYKYFHRLRSYLKPNHDFHSLKSLRHFSLLDEKGNTLIFAQRIDGLSENGYFHSDKSLDPVKLSNFFISSGLISLPDMDNKFDDVINRLNANLSMKSSKKALDTLRTKQSDLGLICKTYDGICIYDARIAYDSIFSDISKNISSDTSVSSAIVETEKYIFSVRRNSQHGQCFLHTKRMTQSQFYSILKFITD